MAFNIAGTANYKAGKPTTTRDVTPPPHQPEHQGVGQVARRLHVTREALPIEKPHAPPIQQPHPGT